MYVVYSYQRFIATAYAVVPIRFRSAATDIEQQLKVSQAGDFSLYNRL